MIKYLNNFSNVNTRNDNSNSSICTQNIKNIMSCTRPKCNIAQSSVHSPAGPSITPALAWRADSSDHTPQGRVLWTLISSQHHSLNTADSILIGWWSLLLPSPNRLQIKKDELEKLFIRTNMMWTPVFPVEVTSSSIQRTKSAPTCHFSDSLPSARSWLTLQETCPQEQTGMLSGGWREAPQRNREAQAPEGTFSRIV